MNWDVYYTETIRRKWRGVDAVSANNAIERAFGDEYGEHDDEEIVSGGPCDGWQALPSSEVDPGDDPAPQPQLVCAWGIMFADPEMPPSIWAVGGSITEEGARNSAIAYRAKFPHANSFLFAVPAIAPGPAPGTVLLRADGDAVVGAGTSDADKADFERWYGRASKPDVLKGLLRGREQHVFSISWLIEHGFLSALDGRKSQNWE